VKRFWILDPSARLRTGFRFSIAECADKVFCFVLCVLLFGVNFPVHAQQQPKKIPRIGYLSAYDVASEFRRAEGIRLALLKLGYIEGHNITTEYRYAEGKRERYPELAAELVRLKVDVIVLAGGLIPIQAVKNATKTIPIVMTGVGADPVKTGLVESLARPGGNVTGITNLQTYLDGKRLELLKESVPKLLRVAVLYDPDVPAGRQVKDDLPATARALGLTIRPAAIRVREDFERVFVALSKERTEGLYASSGLVIGANGKRIADFALKTRLPSIYSEREAVGAGGLMYYGADVADSYRRIATYVDRILKGAKPAELPVEQSTKFEFSINLKTAKQIGLTIPPNVLARADRVIR
jgi:putative ABC transport system substrate-binding protein